MFPIRFRIILIALVSFLFLGFVIYFEYKDIQKKLLTAEISLNVVDNTLLISQLIHPLQKERGLTALHLSRHDKTMYDKLIIQRQSTDDYLKKALSIFKDDEKENIKDLIFKLHDIRSRIDEGTSNWKEVRTFYTSEIDSFLVKLSLKLSEANHTKEITHKLNGVLHLAIARENLGLIRANMSRYYQRGMVVYSEAIDIAQQFSGFNHAYASFRLRMEKGAWNGWQSQIENDVLQSIKIQVQGVLQKKDMKENDFTTLNWWIEATLAIDSMKEVEEELANQIKKYYEQSTSEIRQNIFEYSISTSIILVLITIITISTVYRILEALSILIRVMNQVEQTNDFGLRIKTKVNDEFGQLSFSINNLLDYTDRIVKEKEKLASTDMLTRAMNRRSFIVAAKSEVERHRRYDKSLSLIFCDIDNFKLINDNYGHAMGDEVLKVFSKTIQSNLRESDYFARWGGEEFIILAPETNQVQVKVLAENLRKLVMTISVASVENITCSFGVAQMEKNETFEEFCERSDKAVYIAKSSGRNKVCTLENRS